MSDTPKTDSLLTAILDSDGFVHNGNCPQRWVNHARELERELNAADAEIERLTAKVSQLYEGAEEQKQRIKRMEEAGDRMRLYCADPDDCFAWDMAKKAKL